MPFETLVTSRHSQLPAKNTTLRIWENLQQDDQASKQQVYLIGSPWCSRTNPLSPEELVSVSKGSPSEISSKLP